MLLKEQGSVTHIHPTLIVFIIFIISYLYSYICSVITSDLQNYNKIVKLNYQFSNKFFTWPKPVLKTGK